MERFRDPALSLQERVDDLLGRMSLDEKLAQLGCVWSTTLVRDDRFDADYAAAQMPHGIGQVTRIGASTGLHPSQSAELMNAIQRVAIERTRLGIPIFVHEEAVGGFCHRDATVFPQGIGLAATWNPALVEQVAGVIREQMLAVGARLALAPVLDIARDPRWGRVEETYGEDPVLSGTIGTAYVRGLQTGELRNGVAATGKHFLGYAMSEGGRNWGPVQLGPRELRDVYAEPFAAVIRDAGLAAVMNSYTSVDGLPCAGSPAILTDLLRGELGFEGAVVADYWSIPQLLRFHRVAADGGAAARLALAAGLDVELPALEFYAAPLRAEVEAGRLPVEVVDISVRRVLRLKFQLGLFEAPYVDAEAAGASFQTHGTARPGARGGRPIDDPARQRRHSTAAARPAACRRDRPRRRRSAPAAGRLSLSVTPRERVPAAGAGARRQHDRQRRSGAARGGRIRARSTLHAARHTAGGAARGAGSGCRARVCQRV